MLMIPQEMKIEQKISLRVSNKAAVPVSSVVPLKKPHAALLSKHSGIINRGILPERPLKKADSDTKGVPEPAEWHPDQDRTDNYPLGGAIISI